MSDSAMTNALVAAALLFAIPLEVYLLMRYEDELMSIVDKFRTFARKGKGKQ